MEAVQDILSAIPFTTILIILGVLFLYLAVLKPLIKKIGSDERGPKRAGYHKVADNWAMVKFGNIPFAKKDRERVVTKKGTWVVPFFEDYEMMDLSVIHFTSGPSDDLEELMSQDFQPIKVGWNAQLQVDADMVRPPRLDANGQQVMTPEGVPVFDDAPFEIATKGLLGKNREQLRTIASAIVNSSMREIVAGMSADAVNEDRESFSEQVEDKAVPNLAALGLKLAHLGVDEVSDDHLYYSNRAATQAEEAKKIAEIAAVNREKAVIVEQEEKELRDVERERSVGLADAAREKEVQEANALGTKQRLINEKIEPAQASKQAVEINADAYELERERKSRADAEARKREAEAEAAYTRDTGVAEGDSIRAKGAAVAESEELLAAARAANDMVNIRALEIETNKEVDIATARAYGAAMANILEADATFVQIGGGEDSSSPQGTLFNNMLKMFLQGIEYAKIAKNLGGAELADLLSQGETEEASAK